MKAFSHFKTITHHKILVMQGCFKVGLYGQGLLHDMSKYSPAEFLVGARYYQGDRSTNNAEREAVGYSSAWLHHKGRNKHHYEYWTDINLKTKKVEPVEMPKRYLAEMFCDRVAASKTYNGKNYTNHHPLDYFLKGQARYHMHPQTAKDLEIMLRLLADKGEDEAFAYVKRMVKSDK